MDHHDIMKTIAKAYLSNRGYSVQEIVYDVLPELKLRRIFSAVYFVTTNRLGERDQVLFSEKQVGKIPNDSSNIFKKSNIDCYIGRPPATFYNGKYIVLNNFYYAKANKTSTILKFRLKILPDNEITEGINLLNLNQREVFNVVDTQAKDYVKYDEHNIESVQILFSGSGGVVKSHFVNVICYVISEKLVYHCKI